MRNDLPQQQNSERDIDMFIKRHIFSCFDTILDSHFGEVVSRLQGIIEHQEKNCAGVISFLCERIDSKCEDTSKVLLNTQKTLRDMHQKCKVTCQN
ncbi:hypothetical protein RhiirA4_453266 [Rhizophagus irregularis]|uniref:Uncharacterized protein n=1 Tax=Rhizophagus irregularis TaxID=588596 RepID=A0A2I1G024_9GLOM|nr:hypothetical protein RhiirA4_453266 [Rhizophagus irregularis]